MPKVTYIEHNGTAHTVEVPVGRSVMQGAVDLAALRRRRAEINWEPIDAPLLEAMIELYRQTPAFPSNHWLDNPLREGREAREVSQGVVRRLVELGIFA